MSLQTTTNISVDFYDNKYIMINAKQYDGSSRWITITCYDNGNLFNLSTSKHVAYIRFRKADGNVILNSCRINYKGEVLVELTEQMLSVDGICYADLVIVNKGKAIVNVETGEVITTDGSAILSTRAFGVNVYESPADNRLIESTYEYEVSALNDLLDKANADYTEVYQLAKSWAVGTGNMARENDEKDNSKYYSRMSRSYAIGDADGIRNGENTDNSKYYSERSSDSADKSESYAVGGTGTRNGEDTDNAEYYSRLAKSYTMGSFDGSTGTRNDETTENAKTYMETTKSYMETTDSHMKTTEGYMNTVNGYMGTTKEYMETVDGYMSTTEGYMNTTKSHMDTTQGYMETIEGYMNATQGYMDTAKDHMDNTNSYMDTTQGYMATTQEHMDTAKSYMDNTKTYMDNAKTSETNAKTSETNAATSEQNAKASEIAASNSEAAVKTSETNAATSEQNAYDYSVVSQRYAVGGTGTVENEDIENAKYYYQQVKGINDSLTGVISPKGTIAFEELSTADKSTGYLYIINNSFVTDDSFAEGAGVEYPAGTAVYCTVDGYWACFDGYARGVATVDEVKAYLGI